MSTIIGLDPLPASTGIQARLCRSDLLVEIEREKLEDFSKEALMRMEPTRIVGLNTFTLYKIWALCKYKGKDVKEILKLLFSHPGGLFKIEDYNMQL